MVKNLLPANRSFLAIARALARTLEAADDVVKKGGSVRAVHIVGATPVIEIDEPTDDAELLRDASLRGRTLSGGGIVYALASHGCNIEWTAKC